MRGEQDLSQINFVSGLHLQWIAHRIVPRYFDPNQAEN